MHGRQIRRRPKTTTAPPSPSVSASETPTCTWEECDKPGPLTCEGLVPAYSSSIPGQEILVRVPIPMCEEHLAELWGDLRVSIGDIGITYRG